MNLPAVVSQEEWEAANARILAKEKELTQTQWKRWRHHAFEVNSRRV